MKKIISMDVKERTKEEEDKEVSILRNLLKELYGGCKIAKDTLNENLTNYKKVIEVSLPYNNQYKSLYVLQGARGFLGSTNVEDGFKSLVVGDVVYLINSVSGEYQINIYQDNGEFRLVENGRTQKTLEDVALDFITETKKKLFI